MTMIPFIDESEIPFQLSRFLPVLRRMAAYVSRCGDAVQLAISQVEDPSWISQE